MHRQAGPATAFERRIASVVRASGWLVVLGVLALWVSLAFGLFLAVALKTGLPYPLFSLSGDPAFAFLLSVISCGTTVLCAGLLVLAALPTRLRSRRETVAVLSSIGLGLGVLAARYSLLPFARLSGEFLASP